MSAALPAARVVLMQLGMFAGTALLSVVLLWSTSVVGAQQISGEEIVDTTPAPQGNTGDWRQLLAENFNRPAPTGSLASATDPSKVVYTGFGGTKWLTYPNSWHDTKLKRNYRSDKVLSVHDGVLDFWLHKVDGQPATANPSPVLPDGTQNQTYGRYSVRARVSNEMPGYYMDFLLWPQKDSDGACAESDFPEKNLTGVTRFNTFAHYGCISQQAQFSVGTDLRQWHVYTQDWGPGFRNYYVDGHLVGRTTQQVYDQPQRWQLQTETVPSKTVRSGHIYVDWASVYAYRGPSQKAQAAGPPPGN